MPRAPSRMAVRASSRILSISAGVGLRSTSPRTAARTVPWPKKVPKLTPGGSAATLSRKAPIGSAELPSGPSMSVVTPWRT